MHRLLEAYSLIMGLCMPEDIRNLIEKCKSINLSDVPCTSEDGDFKLEEVNKAV